MIKLLLLLFKAGKFGKLLLSGGSMLLSVLAYSWVYGWRYAAGFVGLIFLHEMGHFWAAKQRGLDVGLPTFIPFIGAWVELKQQPHNAETEAYVGVAGPLVGSVAALALYFLARESGSELLLALSYSGFFLNLFNLIPLSPLDGGRITAVISPKLWLLGVPILLVVFWYRPSPLLLVIAILALPTLIKSIRAGWSASSDYHLASVETRFNYGVLYLGLTGFLAVMCYELSQELPRGF